MELSTIIEIVRMVLYIALGGLALYLQTQVKLKEKVTDLINEAEAEYKDVTKAGGKKFEYVVDKLYSLVPMFFKPFIGREAIGNLVQVVFDKIEDYAFKQLDKVDKIITGTGDGQ